MLTGIRGSLPSKVMSPCIMSSADLVEAKNLSTEASDGSKAVLSNFDKSGSSSGQTIVIIMADSTKELGGTITELTLAPSIIELREYNSVVEDRMVSEVSSMGLEHELERKKVFSPRCDSRGSKHETDSNGEVELKSYAQYLKHHGKCFTLT
ncbi:hypothetical protein VNO77_34839 [Canavalia gladiata]|uniref:Uncharacterized protein n=1 Tax=Canavalia gladiata TaxID=3824 RepID=A0AAN9Q214_CANGL